MIGSILLFAHCRYFVENFGRQKIILDHLQLELSPWFFETSATLEKPRSGHQKAIKQRIKKCTIHNSFHKVLYGGNSRGQFFCPKKYACTVQVHFPECLDDPKHGGHLSWKFCEYLCHQENIGRTLS